MQLVLTRKALLQVKGSLSVVAGTVRNTDAVIVSGGTTTINSKDLHNTENGRIYGGKVAIQTKVLETVRM